MPYGEDVGVGVWIMKLLRCNRARKAKEAEMRVTIREQKRAV